MSIEKRREVAARAICRVAGSLSHSIDRQRALLVAQGTAPRLRALVGQWDRVQLNIVQFDANKHDVEVSLQVMNSHQVHETVVTGKVDFGLIATDVSMWASSIPRSRACWRVEVMRDTHPLS